MINTGVQGSYFLRMKFGDTDIQINPSATEEFTIVQDMFKFLPSFRIKLSDTTGAFTHYVPFDKGMNRVSIEVGRDISVVPDNAFSFLVFRRFPLNQFSAATTYDISGLLDTCIPLFQIDYCRSFKNKTVKSVLEYIAMTELGCDCVDISPSLEYVKLIVQPRWTNAQLLNDLMKRTIGNNGNGAFQCFIRMNNRRKEFVFRSLTELCQSGSVAGKFIIDDRPFLDFQPVFDYQIIDNYRALGILGGRSQRYNYFDYYENKYVNTAYDQYDNFYSLSDYFLIDGDDLDSSDTIIELGRNNEWTKDFQGTVRAVFQNRLINLVKMWITTLGNNKIVPGDIVQVLFQQGASSGSLNSYQFSGYWLVERVVHSFGDTHKTKLLLTRNGLDTDQKTTLLKAKVKR